MEDQLQRLITYVEPKPKSLIVVSGQGARVRTSFNPPLEIPSSQTLAYEMSLLRLETYYSFPNIDENKNHFRISIDHGKTWLDLLIPTGCYEIKSINTVLQRLFIEKTGQKKPESHFALSANKNTLKCILEVQNDSTRVDFNVENTLASVLGFELKIYTRGRYESEKLVNILSVNSILVHCDVIGASRVNGIEAPVIYNFFPDVSPGEKIVSQPLHLIYMPLTMSRISRMTCWMTDQTGKELDLQGEELTLTFHIRKAK